MLINDDQRAVYKTVCLVIFVEIIYTHTHTHTHTEKRWKVILQNVNSHRIWDGFCFIFYIFHIFSKIPQLVFIMHYFYNQKSS